ncbi:hypothetical protein D7V97_29185 [Corallococcus sp. CA053C]|nr:hypothetical protein D7V97_29185 [Corallococcus sp. CA053C]
MLAVLGVLVLGVMVFSVFSQLRKSEAQLPVTSTPTCWRSVRQGFRIAARFSRNCALGAKR